jgi:apolipoprotein N-acyltransferase
LLLSLTRLPARRILTGFGAGMLAGALTGMGRPGIDVLPATLAGVGFLCWVAIVSSWSRASFFAAGFGIGLFTVITWGSMTWGKSVPTMLTAIAVGLYALPLALWSRFAARRLAPGWLFIGTTGVWALCMDLGDLAGYPLKVVTVGLLVGASGLLAGARLVGANTLEGLATAALLVVAQQVAFGARGPRKGLARRLVAAPLAAAAIMGGLAAWARLSAAPVERQLRVGVPQLDADKLYYDSRMTAPAVVDVFSQRVQDLLSQLRDVDLLVTTETFDGRFGLLLPQSRQAWQEYARAHHQAILLSSYLVEADGRKSNAVGGLDPQGRWVGVSRKVDLAPYGERYLAAGKSYEPLAVFPTFSVGSMLCQEAVLPWGSRALTRAGAALLTVGTDDETFGSSVILFDHMGLAQMRAIEVGRSIVWASNGGPSSLIDRWGTAHAGAPLGAPAAAKLDAALFFESTPFLRSARLWPAASAIALGLSLLLGRRARLEGPSAEPARWHPRALVLDGALQLAMMAGAFALWLLSPALVEMSRGDPARAGRAMQRIFAPPLSLLTSADPFARFRTTAGDTARGALGYYLSYFGVEVPPSSQPPRETRSLDDLRQAASEYLPSRLTSLQVDSLPRVATLVLSRDGQYEVMTRQAGEGDVQVFSPLTGRSQAMTAAELVSRAAGRGIIPAAVVCEPGAECHATEP